MKKDEVKEPELRAENSNRSTTPAISKLLSAALLVGQLFTGSAKANVSESNPLLTRAVLVRQEAVKRLPTNGTDAQDGTPAKLPKALSQLAQWGNAWQNWNNWNNWRNWYNWANWGNF